jgi:hypothetical protein
MWRMSKPASSTKTAKKLKPVEPTPSWRLLPESYNLFLDNAYAATVIAIVPALVLQVGATLSLVAKQPSLYQLGLGFQFAGFVLLIANVSASALLQLRAVQGQDTSLGRLYRDSFVFWPRIVGFSLLFALMVAVGLALLIIPGLIVLRRYILTPYFLIDEDIGIREAMQRSAAASKPISRHIWTMILIIFSFSGLGILCNKIWPEYGGFIPLLFPILYNFLPSLRYQEAAYNLRLAEEK